MKIITTIFFGTMAGYYTAAAVKMLVAAQTVSPPW
jgi:hypothetical protein